MKVQIWQIELQAELPVRLLNMKMPKKQKLNIDNAAVFARRKKANFENKLAADTKILSVKMKVREQKECFVYTYTYHLYENIAKTAPIEISKEKK